MKNKRKRKRTKAKKFEEMSEKEVMSKIHRLMDIDTTLRPNLIRFDDFVNRYKHYLETEYPKLQNMLVDSIEETFKEGQGRGYKHYYQWDDRARILAYMQGMGFNGLLSPKFDDKTRGEAVETFVIYAYTVAIRRFINYKHVESEHEDQPKPIIKKFGFEETEEE